MFKKNLRFEYYKQRITKKYTNNNIVDLSTKAALWKHLSRISLKIARRLRKE